MGWASDKAREIVPAKQLSTALDGFTVRQMVERAISETIAKAIKAVQGAGGDNEDYHVEAIRKLGEPGSVLVIDTKPVEFTGSFVATSIKSTGIGSAAIPGGGGGGGPQAPAAQPETAAIAAQVRSLLLPLSDEERLAALRAIGFCRECGDDDPRGGCQCWNDT